MNRTAETFCTTVWWGALWGVSEATVGHFLHIAGFTYGWLFWYPMAFFYMHQAYRSLNTYRAAWGSAVVAAGIKLVDLAAPVRLDFVVNPAIAILLEGAVVSAALKILVQRDTRLRMTAAVMCTSVSWRILYLLYIMFCTPPEWRLSSPLSATDTLFQFIVWESLLNTIFIMAYICLWQWLTCTDSKRRRRFTIAQPAAALMALVIAVTLQWKL